MLLGGPGSIVGQHDRRLAGGLRAAGGAAGFENTVGASSACGAVLLLEPVNATIGHGRLFMWVPSVHPIGVVHFVHVFDWRTGLRRGFNPAPTSIYLSP